MQFVHENKVLINFRRKNLFAYCILFEMLFIIRYHLYNLKNLKNIHGGLLLSLQLYYK